MAGNSIADVVATLQNAVSAVNKLTFQLKTTFPPLTNPTSTAPAGSVPITYNSSQVAAFGLVTSSSGGSYRIALLPSS